jgi:hypothetical protein
MRLGARRTNIRKHIRKALTNHEIDDEVMTCVFKIGYQIDPENGNFPAATLSKLVDLAECEQRLKTARNMAESCESDPDIWLRLASKIQSDTRLKQVILKDLLRAEPAPSAADKKTAKAKAAGKWEGTV